MDDERDVFEKWIVAPPLDQKIERFPETGSWPGDYVDLAVQLAWLAWKAALRHATKQGE
jgi:hypothetical protein